MKRILKEIVKFPEIMKKLDWLYKIVLLEETSKTMPCVGIIDKNNTIILKLYCLSEYPFRPPAINVNINGGDRFIKYDKWLRDIMQANTKNNKIKNCDYFLAWVFTIIRKPYMADTWSFIPNYSVTPCLCCESIICSDKWSPGKQFADILIEYIGRRDFSIHCSKLMQRWITPIFNNDRWILPDEIILHILKIFNENI